MTRPPTREDLERAGEQLRRQYGELLGDVERLEEGATRSPGGALDRQDDEGVITTTQDDDLDLLIHEDELLHALSRALRRLEEGTYGRCSECGKWIDVERLRVLPHADRCIDCARQGEAEAELAETGPEELWRQRRGPALNARVAVREDLNENLSILRVRYDGRDVPEFEPGQFAMLGLPRPGAPRAPGTEEDVRLLKRAYSIASPATERRWVELLLVRVPEGRLTEPLWDVGEGDPVWLDEDVRGKFTLEAVPPDAHLVLVATGTGIAPYMSMLRTYRGRSRWRRLVVVHGVRRSDDLAYRDELERAAREDGTVAYVPVVSREPGPSRWKGLRGRVQDVLDEKSYPALLDEPLDPARAHVLLCGNPDMIRSVGANLVERGFRESAPGQPGNLHHERYW